MGIKQEHEQKKSDYHRLKELLGNRDIDDYCGTWCNNDVLTSMLENPTKRNAIGHYSSLISVYFNRGHESDSITDNRSIPIDVNNHEIYEILKRNGDVG